MSKILSIRSIVTQAYIWLALPLLVFFAAWLRWYVALPSLALLLFTFGYMLRRRKDSSFFTSSHFADVKINRKLIIIATLLLIYTIYCGVGGFFWQATSDHHFRSAVFFDLVKHPWPVTYPPLADGEPRMLCYYIGYWLPAAVMGKLFSGYVMPGNFFLVLYTAWGLFIAISLIISFTGGRPRYLILLIFLFFGGWDLFTSLIYATDQQRVSLNTFLISGINYDSTIYHGTANLSILTAQVFNQGIPALIGCLLVRFHWQKPQFLLLPFSLLFFIAPLPCVGLAVILIPHMLGNLKESSSWQNFASMGLCIVPALYFMQNRNAGTILWHISDGLGPAVLESGIVWLCLGLGIFLPFIWPQVKRNVPFWTLVAFAFFAPFLQMGQAQDFGLRAATPLSIYLLLLVTDAACRVRSWKTVRGKLFAVTLFLASFAPAGIYYFIAYHAVADCIIGGAKAMRDRGQGKLANPEENVFYNNFIATGDGFFSRHLMRHPVNKHDLP